MPPEPFVAPADEYEDTPPTPEAEAEVEARDANPKDETDSATDARAQARKRQKAKFKNQQIEDFWKLAIRSSVGRAAIWECLENAHILETRFASAGPIGFPDPLATMYQAGQRSQGEWLWDRLLRIDFEAFHMMLKEHHPGFIEPKGK